MSEKSESGYHPVTDDAWVDSVSKRIADEVLRHVSEIAENPNSMGAKPQVIPSAEDVQKLQNSRVFLHKAARGFVLEFLAQTRDGQEDLNFTQRALKEAYKKGTPGVFHAKACARGLVKRGLDADEAFYVMGLTIRHAIYTFSKAYLSEPKLDRENDPMASILNVGELIQREVKEFAHNLKNSDTTPDR